MGYFKSLKRCFLFDHQKIDLDTSRDLSSHVLMKLFRMVITLPKDKLKLAAHNHMPPVHALSYHAQKDVYVHV